MISFLYSSNYPDEDTGCHNIDLKALQGVMQGSAKKSEVPTAADNTACPRVGYVVTIQQSDKPAVRQAHCAGVRHLRVYGVADKFDVGMLQEVARQRLLLWIENHGSTDN